jgi:hypothetical protein
MKAAISSRSEESFISTTYQERASKLVQALNDNSKAQTCFADALGSHQIYSDRRAAGDKVASTG